MKRKPLLLSALTFCLSMSTIMCSKSYNNTGNPPPTGGTVVTVTISGMTFSPSTVTVKTGTTVVWKNNDVSVHTATSDDGSTFNTGNIAIGYSGNVMMSKAGTYPYHCTLHSNMTGVVEVTP